MTNIIFLDIDGVLNTENHLRRQQQQSGSMSNKNWCPTACQHIMLLCEQFDARIVVSSTWRYSHEMSTLRNFFGDNGILADFVIGATPALLHEKEERTFCRGDEIRSWLQQNEYRSYVIIDDLPASEFLEEQQPQLVQVQQDKGFADKEAAIRAGRILDAD